MSYNRVVLMGRLGSKPELKYTATSLAVASFSLATSEKSKDKETTQWHNIKAFGKRAETMEMYLDKGRQVLIEGKLQYEHWEDKQGNKKSRATILVDNFKFIGEGNGSSRPKKETVEYTPEVKQEFTTDDLPF